METTTSTIDDQSLLDFVAGTQPATEDFPKTTRPLLKTFARHAAPELPYDIRDEVVSQSLEFLIEYGKRFQPARGTAKSFLKLMAGQAARRVRADYRAPWGRTRPDRVERPARPKVVFLSDTDVAHPETLNSLCARSEVRSILRRAPAKIAEALFLIYFAGESVAAAAQAVGLSRFALRREILRFMRTVRGTGAA